MPISLKAERLRHYRDFALLLFKYGRRDLVQRAGLSELLPNEPQHDRKAAAAAEEFAADIERLGPTTLAWSRASRPACRTGCCSSCSR